jgi:hypothetical protein
MANITTTTAAVFLPTLWSIEVLRATEAALVFAGLVQRFDSQVQARGQTLTIPNISNLTANLKVANTDVTTQAVTETQTVLNINSWYESSFEIEDIVSVQSNYDLRSLYSEKVGYAIAKRIDTDVAANYTSFTTTPQGTYGTDISDAVIVSAILELNLGDIAFENRAFIVHPNELAAIMKLDKYVAATYLGEYAQPTPVVKGPKSRYMWGELWGIPLYYTTNVPQTAGTPTQTHNMLIQKEAIALALQQAPRLQAAYWLPSLAWKVVCDAIYGTAAWRTAAGVELKS